MRDRDSFSQFEFDGWQRVAEAAHALGARASGVDFSPAMMLWLLIRGLDVDAWERRRLG